MAKYLNENIKYLRIKNGISQQGLADKIGIDRSTISRIENNEIDTTIDNAIKIADALNVPLPDLIGKELKNNDEIDNQYDKKIKELETTTGIKISYAKEKSLTQEDYLAINQLVLDEMKAQEDKKWLKLVKNMLVQVFLI